MSKACLGAHFDIHGGGPDLIFPHHENEIAQSEAANQCPFANYWLHAGAVRVDGQKMSKSLGNFFTIREVLQKYHPEVVRYLLVSTHYRSPIHYSEANLLEAKAGLERFYNTLKNYPRVAALPVDALAQNGYYPRFVDAMNDDFNARTALSVMYDMIKAINSATHVETARTLVATLKAMANILGILQTEPRAFLQTGSDNALMPEQIEDLINERRQAKLVKNYARADVIRNRLKQQGIVLEDSPKGTTWRRE